MAKVLIIESSARQQGSSSRELTQEFISRWKAAHPNDQITVRDLAVEQVPHLDLDLLTGWIAPASEHTALQAEALARSNLLTNELLEADVLVMAAPMYNFAIPSTLKAWLDHVLRAGVTFKYTANGPQGLLSGKRAIALTSRGGVYAGTPLDHQEGYLRQAMAFIGIHDVSFVHAEGLNLSPEHNAKGMQAAKAQLAAVVQPTQAA